VGHHFPGKPELAGCEPSFKPNNKNKATIYRHRNRGSNNTFIGGYLWYGAVPVASSMAVIPKLQMSALKL